jgi:hypothetical protein
MGMEELLDLERDGWDALCKGTGSEFYGSLMTDEAVMVLANGQVMDRDGVRRALADAPPWDSYDIDEPRITPIGEAAAALVYVGTGRRGEQTFVGTMTSVYVRAGSQWRLALYQQTPLAARGAA